LTSGLSLDGRFDSCIHLEDGLKDTAIINIGRLATNSRFFTRVLHLHKNPNGRSFLPELSVVFSFDGATMKSV
jgi:hypothetical protein